MSEIVERLREHDKDPTGRPRLGIHEEAASRISQQDAELERVRRELEEAKEFRAILEGHLSAAIDDYNEARARAEAAEAKLAEARKAAFIEAAEIATSSARDLRNGDAYRFASSHIASVIRAKAEETRT